MLRVQLVGSTVIGWGSQSPVGPHIFIYQDIIQNSRYVFAIIYQTLTKNMILDLWLENLTFWAGEAAGRISATYPAPKLIMETTSIGHHTQNEWSISSSALDPSIQVPLIRQTWTSLGDLKTQYLTNPLQLCQQRIHIMIAHYLHSLGYLWCLISIPYQVDMKILQAPTG